MIRIKHGWGNIEMWEVFKILLLCLFSVFIATLTASWLYISVILLVLVVLLHDFDFTTGIERHAINKLKYSYLKVRNLYAAIFERDQNITSFQYTPTMNSINKQTTSFELSRFNKSGNALSPITNSANSGAFTSRRLIQPRQTSTPLTRTSPWQNSISPATNHNRTPIFHNPIPNRRYSLSSLTPKSVNNESPNKPTIQTVTGPLLASTRFNVNLGTYTDTKSPGLASRVVQYHNELSGNQTSTHQTKYGSPGQFPIVQLYKKELPILGRPVRRCTVRIAPPDPISYNSDHTNTILRDSFVQNNVENTNHQNDTEINTRSVLEALKEISRKRIHTDDDLDDISKRQRKNSVSSNNSVHLNKDGKRMREDTPPKPKESSSTPVTSAPKRICVVNEIESSLSSSRLMRLQQGQKRKSSLNIPETNKQRRISNGELISRETQTTVTNGSKASTSQNSNKNTQKTTSTAAQTETEAGSGMLDIQLILDSTRRKKKLNEIRSIRDIDEENSTLQFAKSNAVPAKSLFSEAPLEIMKQNKLSVMLSALGGNEPEIIPLPDMTLSALKKKSEDNPDGTDLINKEVVSILSPKNKVKHDKHVTFAIPNSDAINNDTAISTKYNETVSETNSSIVPPASTSSMNTSNANNSGSTVPFSVPSTSINFSSPITFGTSSLQTNVSNLPAFSAISTAVTGSNVPSTSITTENNIMFGSVSPSTSKVNTNSVTTTTNSTNIITSSAVDKSENSASKNVINFGSVAPNFNFGSSKLVNPLGGLVPSSTTNAQAKKPNDLSKTSSATSGMPGFQFSSPSASNVPSAPIAFGSTVPSSSVAFTSLPLTAISTSSLPTINFGAKSSAFTSTTSAVTTSASAGINFGTTASQQPSSSIVPSNASTMLLKTSAPTAGTVQLKTSAPTTTTASASGMFNFGAKSEAKNTTSPTFNFSSPASNSQSQPKTGGFKFDLGKSVTTSSAISSKTETPKTGMFGVGGSSTLNKSGAFPFGASNPATNATSAFNTSNNTSTSTPVFGIQSATTSTPSFGTTNKTVSTGIFGVPSTSANTGVFGTPNTTSATGVFGTTTTTTSGGAFGTPVTTLTSGAFGTPSTTTSTAVFGSSNATPNTAIFGTTPSSSSAFGAAKTSETAPGFSAFGASGSASNPGFGTTTQNSNTFGFGTAVATTTQNNAFGGTPATTTSTFTFGTTSASKPFSFGVTTTATTTAPPPMFGSTPSTTSTNLFGGNASSGFGGASGAASTFGPTTTTAQSTFGQQSSSGAFGTASSGFGTGTSASVFGTNTNNTNNNTFGSSATSNVFGASTQQPSSFGTGTPNQGNVFGVSNNNQATGVFGATNSSNNNNTFGSTTNASFGGGFSNNNAQSSGIGNFGSPATQAPSQSGVFAFGNAAQASSSTPTASNAFQFGGGNQTPKPSGFNFSANSNTPNLNFASGTTPAFNATSPPAFGSPAPGQFSTPAPSTGMFNIGSGSTAPKQRPMIKARRRN